MNRNRGIAVRKTTDRRGVVVRCDVLTRSGNGQRIEQFEEVKIQQVQQAPGRPRLSLKLAPSIERLVFPFKIENDKKEIVKDREKIFAFAKTLLTEQQSTKDSNSDGGRGLFMSSSKGRKTKLRGEDSWLRASELPQPMPPTHFLQVAGQSARAIADDGSTEGGIAESLAMMNGEVAKSLMSKASDTDTTVKKTTRKKTTRKENRGKRKTMQSVQSGGTKTSQDKGTQAMQITAIYSAMLSRPPRTQDMKQCLNALDQGLGFDDIVWALLNSREFMFIQ